MMTPKEQVTIDQIKELAGHRTVPPWVMKLVQEAVEIEREACAKVCDEIERHKWEILIQGEKLSGLSPRDCAAAIRARSNK